MPLTFAQTLTDIFSHVDYSRTRQIPYNANTYNLQRMRELCARIGNPQDQFPSFHIAGSKGKGSTAAMTESVLRAAGYRTGIYTSPHMHTFRERIRVDAELIPRQRLVDLWAELRPHAEALPHTTTFEIITALAFMAFARAQIDWGVLEVGLGGRLDATNVVHPQACAITSLSYEHTDLLGHTLSLIAFEKAGIIKPGVSVIVGPQEPEALAVINDVAHETGAQTWQVGREWHYHVRQADQHGLRIDVHGPDVDFMDLTIALSGLHQAANATVAVGLIESMRRRGLDISEEALRRGLANTYWPGRLELLSQHPHLLTDSAHTRQSAERLAAALEFYPHKRLILLFGASSDKDIDGMLHILGNRAAEIVVTCSTHPRAADPEAMAKLARDIVPSKPVSITRDIDQALDYTLSLAGDDDLILVTGSIFVVAGVREAWLARNPHDFAAHDWARVAEPIQGNFSPMLESQKQNPDLAAFSRSTYP